MSSNFIIKSFNQYFNTLKIDIVKYNLNSNDWWHDQQGILLKTYVNISNDVIEKGSKIIIKHKIQTNRFNTFLHRGEFFIMDCYCNQIGGVDYRDILLLDSD